MEEDVENNNCLNDLKVQNISANPVIGNDGESINYKLNNPNKIGFLFLAKNEPFCLAYIKKEKEDFLNNQKESIIQKTENETYIINETVMENISQNINNVITKTVTNVCNNATISSIQYNELDFSGVSFCSELNENNICEKLIFNIDQENEAYISLDSKFQNDLSSQLSTDLKNEISNQITNNITEKALDDLMTDLNYERNEDIFNKLLGIYSIGNKKTTEIENSIKNIYNSRTSSTTKLMNIIETTVDNSDLKDIVNQTVINAKQYNKGKVENTSYHAKNIEYVWAQKNTSELIAKSLIKNKISTQIMNSLIGDTQGFSENIRDLDKETKTDSKTETAFVDSLFGATSTWQILIVGIVVIVIALVVLSIMGGGAGTAGQSGASGGIVKLVVGLIILLIIIAVIIWVIETIKKSKKKKEKQKKEEEKEDEKKEEEKDRDEKGEKSEKREEGSEEKGEDKKEHQEGFLNLFNLNKDNEFLFTYTV